ncbi:MAG: hypothetical protein JO256_07070 [Alphaproteobacteria bacterium]|nr:hypothetical protein [Alphaproteobacteria bacterium]
MRPDPVIEFWLGLAAILAVVAVALVLAFPPAWLDDRQTAVANFRSLGLLMQGANVRENGNVVGNVTAVEAKGSYYRVHMKIKKGWQMAPDQGLTVDETNPLQAPALAVARQCRAAAPGAMPSAGCCPEALANASADAGEVALASCGVSPNLVDAALATTLQARDQITALRDAVQKADLPALLKKTEGAVAATTSGMAAMKAVSDKALSVLNTNGDKLTSILAKADTTLGNVSNTTKTVDDFLTTKKEQLDTSITNVSSILATTAATLPGVVTDLKKAAEDMRVITGQVRNEPTQLIRRRERSDPSFVDPAEK